MRAPRARLGAIALALAVASAALAGCGGGSGSAQARAERTRTMQAYLARVEPIRLGVNRLLGRADPILSAYGRRRLSSSQAERRISLLERRFAASTVEINALQPVPVELAAAQRAYAHTYILEDAYLSALDAALPGRRFDDLPKTQNAQRAAIIAWRTRLQVVADQLGVRLPDDIQLAGRGEIAPSPLGS